MQVVTLISQHPVQNIWACFCALIDYCSVLSGWVTSCTSDNRHQDQPSSGRNILLLIRCVPVFIKNKWNAGRWWGRWTSKQEMFQDYCGLERRWILTQARAACETPHWLDLGSGCEQGPSGLPGACSASAFHYRGTIKRKGGREGGRCGGLRKRGAAALAFYTQA